MKKVLILISIFLSVNLLANDLSVIKQCNNTKSQDTYNVKRFCIDGEEIIRKNILDPYGGDNVQYSTKSNKYKSIVSYNKGDEIKWVVTRNDDIVLTYANKETIKNFAVVTYTGNGSSQSIITGINSVDFTQAFNGSGYWLDRTTNQVKNDAGTVVESGTCDWGNNKGISKVHIKNRDGIVDHTVADGLRGYNKRILTNQTIAELTDSNGLSDFTTTGFSLNTSSTASNGNGIKYVAYQTLYTHIKWGLTNQSKLYVEAYNPITKEGMIYYIGSGEGGHSIPHSVESELSISIQKNLDSAYDWFMFNEALGNDKYLKLNTTDAEISLADVYNNTSEALTVSSHAQYNQLNSEHISYYKAKSPTWTIVQYQGTGASGNFIETKDVNGVARKPRRIITKAISSGSEWIMSDSQRGEDYHLKVNKSEAEHHHDQFDINSNGFTTKDGWENVSGVQYIALVEFDTNGDGGDSYTSKYFGVEVGEKEYKLAKVNSVSLSYQNSEVSFIYDANNEHKLSKISITKDGNTQQYSLDDSELSKQLTKTYTYDENSLLIRKTVSGTDIETRVTKYEHGTIDSNYAVKTINALDQITTKVYDENNNLIKLADINGLTTSWEYDSQNRMTKEIKPSGVVTTFTYSENDLIDNASYKVTKQTKNNPTVVTYFDNMDRKISIHKDGFDGRTIIEDIHYDENGKESKHSTLHFSSDEPALVDVLNKDVENKLSSNKTYSFDALGNITQIIDNSTNETTSLTYDALNRVVQKDNTYYVYDRANYGEGKLAYIKSDNYKKEFFYDELSRLSAVKEYIDNKIFATQYSYTEDGKIATIINPDGFKAIYEYNELGYFVAVKTPLSNSSEIHIDNIKPKLEQNLNDELDIYKEYVELKTKSNFY